MRGATDTYFKHAVILTEFLIIFLTTKLILLSLDKLIPHQMSLTSFQYSTIFLLSGLVVLWLLLYLPTAANYELRVGIHELRNVYAGLCILLWFISMIWLIVIKGNDQTNVQSFYVQFFAHFHVMSMLIVLISRIPCSLTKHIDMNNSLEFSRMRKTRFKS